MTRLAASAGHSAGFTDGWKYLVGAIGAAAVVLAVVAAAGGFR